MDEMFDQATTGYGIELRMIDLLPDTGVK